MSASEWSTTRCVGFAAHLAVLAVSVVEVLFLAQFLRSSLVREYFAVVD